jgi:hypothetical protein
MKTVELPLGELFGIGATRGMLGAGVALILGEKLGRHDKTSAPDTSDPVECARDNPGAVSSCPTRLTIFESMNADSFIWWLAGVILAGLSFS